MEYKSTGHHPKEFSHQYSYTHCKIIGLKFETLYSGDKMLIEEPCSPSAACCVFFFSSDEYLIFLSSNFDLKVLN